MEEFSIDEAVCECGHLANDHHISWFWGSPVPLIEECEYWGWNEHGGAEWLEDEERWIPHCNKFKEAK